MSLRCAVCGSKKLVLETKKEGYDLKKGVVGQALIGIPGALAGMDGKESVYYHCADCGQVLNKPMFSMESDNIDRLLECPDIWKSQLKEMKAKYKNIEWEDSNNAVKKEVSPLLRVDQIADEILIHLNQIGTLVEERELEKRYSNEKFSLDESNLYQQAIKKLIKSGRVCKEYLGDKECLRLVTDVKEIQDKYLREAADEYANAWRSNTYDSNRHITLIFNNIDIQKKYTRVELRTILKELLSNEVVTDNPYALDCVAARLEIELSKKKLLIRENGNLCSFRSLEEGKRTYEEKIKAAEEAFKLKREKKKEVILKYLNANFGMHDVFEMLENSAEFAEYGIMELEVLLEEMEKEKTVEIIKKDFGIICYAVAGYTEKLEKEEAKRKEEERKRREEKKESLNKEIAQLKTEIAEQEKIVAANKSKLFGEGAKAKKAAQKEIDNLNNIVACLETEFANL